MFENRKEVKVRTRMEFLSNVRENRKMLDKKNLKSLQMDRRQ